MNFRHKYLDAAALTAVLALLLVSCGKGEDVIDASATGNTLLEYVPDDTPYLAGNLEPVPNDVIDANFNRAQPVLDAVQEVLGDTRIKLSGSVAEENPEMAIMGAVLNELDGKLNRRGLESLGFTLDGYQVVYGMGVFPVVRVSLTSAQALRDTLGRIEANSGIDFTQRQHAGQSYWNLAPEGSGGDVPLGIYLAIIEEAGNAHLAFSLFPLDAESELLPAFLGQVEPADDSAAMRLAAVGNEYGYAHYGSGLVDFQALFDRAFEPSSQLHRILIENGVDPNEHFDAICQGEIRELIAHAPRLIGGITELTPDTVGFQYRLELADDLAGELAELVSEVPAAPSTTDRLLEFAFGIRVGAARDFLLRKATALSQKSFRCEALQGINAQASKMLTRLNYPVPPLVNNFLGLRASLDQLPEDEGDLEAVRGAVALHVNKPEMFVGMAQMFLPQLAEFQLTKGDPPVRLPESLMPTPGVVAYAAMSNEAIGIAFGEGEDMRLSRYLEVEPRNNGSFLSANYDMAAYMERIETLTDGMYDDALRDYERMQRKSGESGGANDADREQAREMLEAVQQAMRNMAGRSQFALRFDEGGFAIDSRMEFKN